MKIDLRELEETSGELAGSDRIELTDGVGDEAEFDCDVRVRYNNGGSVYYLHVVADARFETVCHRCLDPVGLPLNAEFDLVVRRGIDRAELRGDAGVGDDFITVGTNEHEVSLHPFIHENLVVNIPMLILCSDDCKGMCPECGENRNHGACDCRPAEDSRWDDLRKLSDD